MKKGKKNKNSLLNFALFLVAILTIYFRAPIFFSEPRFWAEEGRYYFAYAYVYPWYESLFFVFRGYFSLFNNIAAKLAATLVELEYAPLITTLLAFVIQAVPLAIVLWGKSGVWGSTARKVVGILIVIFTPLSGEIWLNTVNSQFCFSLITFLILIENTGTATRYKVWFNRVMLVLSGLTGVVSCFLTPLFIFKAWTEREREYIVQAGILTMCTTVQLLIVVSSLEEIAAKRSVWIDFPTLLSYVWVKSVALSFCGPDGANVIATTFNRIRDLGSGEFALLGVVLFFFTAILLGYISWGVETKKRLMILGSYFLIIMLTTVSALGDKSAYVGVEDGQRYFYVPNVILLTLVLHNIQFNRSASGEIIRSSLCSALLAVSLVLGIASYKSTVSASDDWPKWSREVSKWRDDPGYELQIWPPGWSLKLKE